MKEAFQGKNTTFSTSRFHPFQIFYEIKQNCTNLKRGISITVVFKTKNIFFHFVKTQ
jgi:hypothetical protein